MYTFQQYNPALPQIITSFKGNQKLILGGYRYNIHHVKEGVKTWRCVCAKKLTGARSWCKGRAETWDNDGKGLPKGEHNHLTEHDLAELEYFKSQLIFAAIASPEADLNALIDEAAKFLSDGLTFGNRESMKKSLLVARKSAESGELKLGQQPHRTTLRGGGGVSRRSSTVRSMKTTAAKGQPRTLATAKPAASMAQAKNSHPASTSTAPSVQSTPANAKSSRQFAKATLSSAQTSASFLLNSSVSSGTSSGFGGSEFSGAGSDANSSGMDWSAAAGLANGSLLFENGAEINNNIAATGSQQQQQTSATAFGGGVNLGGASNEQILAAALFAAAMLSGGQQQQHQQEMTNMNGSGGNGTMGHSPQKSQHARKSAQNHQTAAARNFHTVSSAAASTATSVNSSFSTPPAPPANSAVNVKRKSARVNGILQKLCSKAAADSTSVSPSPPLSANNPPSVNDATNELAKEEKHINQAPNTERPQMATIGTQTETTMTEESASGGTEDTKRDASEARKRRHQSSTLDKKEDDEADFVCQQQPHNGHCCRRKLICCCCCDDSDEEGPLDLDENDIPPRCKKRARLMAMKSVTASQSAIKKEPKMEPEEEEEEITNESDDLELFGLESGLKLEIAEEEEDEEAEEAEDEVPSASDEPEEGEICEDLA